MFNRRTKPGKKEEWFIAHVGRLEISYSSVDFKSHVAPTVSTRLTVNPLAAYMSIHQLKNMSALRSRRTWRRGEPGGGKQRSHQ